MKKHLIVLIVLYALLALLSLNRHSKAVLYSFTSEIWADRAGYFVYMPATFIYNWDADKLPNGITKKQVLGLQ
ncbi:MAG: hypothetical protein SGJ10_03415 [Bacteroidota bacterium]|nr:hypothetical protein [Bacteroidota bacterium]